MWPFDWYQNLWPLMTLNGEMALNLHYFTEFGSFRGVLRKTDWQSHIMDNLRLLCLVVNVCRGTARRPRYKYSITARFCSRFINSRFNAQYLPSYRLICLNEVSSLFWYFEVRVRYRRKKVYVLCLISWWVLVLLRLCFEVKMSKIEVTKLLNPKSRWSVSWHRPAHV